MSSLILAALWSKLQTVLYLLREQHHQEMPPVLAQVETEFSSQPLIILKLNEDNYGPFLNHSIAQTG